MPRLAHFMLSKSYLALAQAIDDSLSHTVTHFPARKADINPFQTFCPATQTGRQFIERLIDTERLGTNVTSHCPWVFRSGTHDERFPFSNFDYAVRNNQLKYKGNNLPPCYSNRSQ